MTSVELVGNWKNESALVVVVEVEEEEDEEEEEEVTVTVVVVVLVMVLVVVVVAVAFGALKSGKLANESLSRWETVGHTYDMRQSVNSRRVGGSE